MKIDIRNMQGLLNINKKKITKWAQYILEKLDEKNAELSLLFVDDIYIKELNIKYRGINATTDVLAFPMRGRQGITKDSPILGDVVISTETAKKEALKRNIPIEKEICLYLTHGILHLVGYDDKTSHLKKKMSVKTKELMEAF